MKTPVVKKQILWRGLLYRPWPSFAILLTFIFNILGPFPTAQAQEFRLPTPGVMVHLSPPLNPPLLKGIKVHPDNPFKFDFILDQGDNSLPLRGEGKGEGNQEQLKQEATRLIKYFLASLTIPEKDLWVNLSPYEKDRIIPQSFGLTEMGRDLLAEDYMLKQITASLIYPEDAIGKKFWKKIYEEAAQKYGTTNIPVNTFNKVWIVPDKAIVYENAKAGTAYVQESKLKVMLEQDYLSLEKHVNYSLPLVGRAREGGINALGSQITREIVIPELTKEVNENKNFAQLRQVYNSLILATWYKKKIRDSILEQVYADRSKTVGVRYENSVVSLREVLPNAAKGDAAISDTELIYRRYLQAFKKGVYNYIKEDVDPATQEMIPRKYFSGGVIFNLLINAAGAMQVIDLTKINHALIAHEPIHSSVVIAVSLGIAAVKHLLGDGSMMTSVVQRPAISTTFDSLSKMEDGPLKQEARAFVTRWLREFEEVGADQIAQFWEIYDHGYMDIYISFIDEGNGKKVVASCCFLKDPKSLRKIYDNGLYVDIAYRNKGIGYKILNHALADLKEQGYAVLEIGGQESIFIDGHMWHPSGIAQLDPAQGIFKKFVAHAQANNAVLEVKYYNDPNQDIHSLVLDLSKYQPDMMMESEVDIVKNKASSEKVVQFHSFFQGQGDLSKDAVAFVNQWLRVAEEANEDEIHLFWAYYKRGCIIVNMGYLNQEPVASYCLLRDSNRDRSTYVYDNGIYVDKKYEGGNVEFQMLEHSIVDLKARGFHVLDIGNDNTIRITELGSLPRGILKNSYLQDLYRRLLGKAQESHAVLDVKYYSDRLIQSLVINLQKYQSNEGVLAGRNELVAGKYNLDQVIGEVQQEVKTSYFPDAIKKWISPYLIEIPDENSLRRLLRRMLTQSISPDINTFRMIDSKADDKIELENLGRIGEVVNELMKKGRDEIVITTIGPGTKPGQLGELAIIIKNLITHFYQTGLKKKFTVKFRLCERSAILLANLESNVGFRKTLREYKSLVRENEDLGKNLNFEAEYYYGDLLDDSVRERMPLSSNIIILRHTWVLTRGMQKAELLGFIGKMKKKVSDGVGMVLVNESEIPEGFPGLFYQGKIGLNPLEPDKWEETGSIPHHVDEDMESKTEDKSMINQKKDNSQLGGIDLTAANLHLQTRNNGGSIKFTVDAAMLQKLRNSPGLVPSITDVQPLKSLSDFLEPDWKQA